MDFLFAENPFFIKKVYFYEKKAMRTLYILVIGLFLTFISCQKNDAETRQINDYIVSDSLRLNQIQVIGSHNSYRIRIDQDIYEKLLTLQGAMPASLQISELDYTHIPLQDQFYDYGIRQIELDLYLDPNGGRFYSRKGNGVAGRDEESKIEALKKPGIKIMHIPDVDFNTHYYSFKDALRDIKDFSNKNPNHLPIAILLEMKTETINDYIPNVGFASALPWDLAGFMEMEKEILAVFEPENIIKPDDIRKNETTLRQGLLTNGWPTIGESRGKVMFMFTNTNEQNITYKQGAPSLENRLCFTNANPNEDDAAFLKIDDPVFGQEDIRKYVQEGFLIRTRTDAGTVEARNGDYSMFNAALSSGAQFLSTDYYKPDYRAKENLEFTNYSVSFGNKLYRENPVSH